MEIIIKQSQLYPEYWADEEGNVYIEATIYKRKEYNILEPLQGFRNAPEGKTRRGYRVVGYNKDKTKVHRIVADAWVPNPENKNIVHHRDEIKTHNQASNLQWVTLEEHLNLHGKYLK